MRCWCVAMANDIRKLVADRRKSNNNLWNDYTEIYSSSDMPFSRVIWSIRSLTSLKSKPSPTP